jgi:hypothetical protein
MSRLGRAGERTAVGEEVTVPANVSGGVAATSRSSYLVKKAPFVGRGIARVEEQAFLHCSEILAERHPSYWECAHLLKLLTGVDTSTCPVRRSGSQGKKAKTRTRTSTAAAMTATFLLSTGIVRVKEKSKATFVYLHLLSCSCSDLVLQKSKGLVWPQSANLPRLFGRYLLSR